MTDINYSVAHPHPAGLDAMQRICLAVVTLGILLLLAGGFGLLHTPAMLYASLSCILVGGSLYSWRTYSKQTPGIKNNHVWHNALTNRGVWGWCLGIFLTGFYILLYWFPQYLGLGGENAPNKGLIAFFDPLSKLLNGNPASQWFVYGTLYTLAIVTLGIKFMLKYRHSRYHLVRTSVVMVSQLFLAYLIPEIMASLSRDGASFNKDIKYFWPLNYNFFEPWNLDAMQQSGSLGMFYLIFGIFLFTIATPVLTYFLGKRWYCSWVCGCGGLAETAGDPFRHLSSKKVSAWKLERYLVHAVLLFIIIVTAVVLYGYFSGQSQLFGLDIYKYFSRPYGFLIGAIFSGIVGVGFYPLLGNRVWCRFGCPLAAYIGIFQRFKSRFRISTNGGQCISCGNCSTYCEQGIDVRWYAQRGQNIVRASCVGCGVCSSVCPRGVLKLENGPEENRFNGSSF